MQWLALAGIGLLAYFFARPTPKPQAPPSSPSDPSSLIFGKASDGLVTYSATSQSGLASLMQAEAWVALMTPESIATGQALIGPPALLTMQGADVSSAPLALRIIADASPSFDTWIATPALSDLPAVLAFVQRGQVPKLQGTGSPPVAKSVSDALSPEPRMVRFSQAGDVFFLG